jgi:Transposase, Mutator family
VARIKRHREIIWFRDWVFESYSVRKLSHLSGHSPRTLWRIISYWLDQKPIEKIDFSHSKYLIYDGTYFHKEGCLISLMEARSQKIIAHIYERKEGYQTTVGWFRELRDRGLEPLYITMDGELSVIRAIGEIWPQTKIQRCLYHIQREGMRWLRSTPKTEAGALLRELLKTVCQIRTKREKDLFILAYASWANTYREDVLALPRTQVAFKDLKRTMVLIKNAIPDMFYYLDNPSVPKTTNTLEGYYSRLKADYRQHRGISGPRKISYLSWYCYFKNHA